MAFRKHQRRSQRLKLQSLSERIVPAITFTNTVGHLTIIGDDNDNTIELAVSGDKKFIVRFGAPNIPALNTGVPVKTTTRITVLGNGGKDFLSVASIGSVSVKGPTELDGGEGNDTLIGSPKSDDLDGGNGNDSLFGGAGNDTVFGGAGNDTLTGATGNDFIGGGDNIDTLLEIGNVNFTLISAFGASLNAGTLGTDSLSEIETARLIGGSGNNVLNASAFFGSVFLDGGSGNDTLIGGLGNDTLVGNSGRDSMVGNDGDDTLGGGSGNDTLRGNDGDDHLTGFTGVDLIDGGADSDRINETFTSTAAKTITLAETSLRRKEGSINELDSLVSIESANMITQLGNNRISAADFDGSATLIGGAGNDTLVGGSGDDELNGAGGTDRVELTTLANATLTDTSLTDFFSIDSLENFESAIIRARIGFTVPNRLDASAFSFNVQLFGDAGNDTLLGGAGNDTLSGGSGSDQLEGNNGNDFLDGGSGADTILGGNGNDSAPLDNTDFVNLGAGEDGFFLQGTDGDDVILIKRLVGVDGPEAIVEINGETIVMNYVQGETISVFGGKGNDLIAMDSSAGDIWKAHFFGGTGNDMLVGRGKADFLDGGIGNDTLHGNGGDDVLIGGKGVDQLDGGDGVDLLISLDRGWIDWVHANADDVWHRDGFDKQVTS